MNQRKLLDWKYKKPHRQKGSQFGFWSRVHQDPHDLKYIFQDWITGFSQKGINSFFFKGKHESLDLQSHRFLEQEAV